MVFEVTMLRIHRRMTSLRQSRGSNVPLIRDYRFHDHNAEATDAAADVTKPLADDDKDL